MLEREEGGVDEHEPADHPHDYQPVAKHRIVYVEHLTTVSMERVWKASRSINLKTRDSLIGFKAVLVYIPCILTLGDSPFHCQLIA